MKAEELPLKNYKMPVVEKQIYILDDDESVLRSLKLLMVSYGFAVDVFSTAETFFNAVPNNATGCLILRQGERAMRSPSTAAAKIALSVS